MIGVVAVVAVVGEQEVCFLCPQGVDVTGQRSQRVVLAHRLGVLHLLLDRLHLLLDGVGDSRPVLGVVVVPTLCYTGNHRSGGFELLGGS